MTPAGAGYPFAYDIHSQIIKALCAGFSFLSHQFAFLQFFDPLISANMQNCAAVALSLLHWCASSAIFSRRHKTKHRGAPRSEPPSSTSVSQAQRTETTRQARRRRFDLKPDVHLAAASGSHHGAGLPKLRRGQVLYMYMSYRAPAMVQNQNQPANNGTSSLYLALRGVVDRITQAEPRNSGLLLPLNACALLAETFVNISRWALLFGYSASPSCWTDANDTHADHFCGERRGHSLNSVPLMLPPRVHRRDRPCDD